MIEIPAAQHSTGIRMHFSANQCMFVARSVADAKLLLSILFCAITWNYRKPKTQRIKRSNCQTCTNVFHVYPETKEQIRIFAIAKLCTGCNWMRFLFFRVQLYILCERIAHEICVVCAARISQNICAENCHRYSAKINNKFRTMSQPTQW